MIYMNSHFIYLSYQISQIGEYNKLFPFNMIQKFTGIIYRRWQNSLLNGIANNAYNCD